MEDQDRRVGVTSHAPSVAAASVPRPDTRLPTRDVTRRVGIDIPVYPPCETLSMARYSKYIHRRQYAGAGIDRACSIGQVTATDPMQGENSVISSLPGNNPERRPALPEHRAQVRHECLRLLVRGEVASSLVVRLEHDVPHLASPPENARSSATDENTQDADARLGQGGEFLGEVRQAARDRAPRDVILVRLGDLIVDPHRRSRAQPREPIHRDPRQHYTPNRTRQSSKW